MHDVNIAQGKLHLAIQIATDANAMHGVRKLQCICLTWTVMNGSISALLFHNNRDESTLGSSQRILAAPTLLVFALTGRGL